MTRQRAVILDFLRNVTTHPTAEEIYAVVRARIPRISLGTVYRNLDVLTHSGDILCLEQAGVQRRFDGNTEPHQHVRCTQCGRVGDVTCSVPLPACSAVRAEGFSIDNVSLMFTGLCRSCRPAE